MTLNLIDLNLIDLNLIDHGGEGEPLVFIHGFLGSGQDWFTTERQNYKASVLARYRCLTVDLPGHGDSRHEVTAGEEFVITLNDIARQLHETLRNHGLERVSLLGYSLGGRVAMAFTDLFPERVDTLFLEGAHPGLQSEPERQQRKLSDAAWSDRFLHEPLESVLMDWYRQPVFSSLDDESRRQLVKERARNNDGRILAAILTGCSLSQQSDYRRLLRQRYDEEGCNKEGCEEEGCEKKSVVVYFVGEYDKKFRLLADSLARSGMVRAIIVADAGHNAHRDNPAGFIEALLSL